MASPSQADRSPRSSLSAALLDWRSRFGFGWLQGTLLAIYVLVLGITIPHHEPWADEAQAWLIARDNSVWQILRYRLHYEGWPGLWHVILHLYHVLGGQYTSIDWLGGAFATVGIIVFLRWSPFPLLIRILLPFTFFLQYQYAVIARGYVLFPLLAFSLCVLFYKRRHSLWFALAAGLLANLSLQGAVYSFFLVGLYLVHRYRSPELPGVSASHRGRRLLLPAAVYAVFLAVSALTAVPAPDCHIGNGPPLATGVVQQWLMRYPGPLPKSERLPVQPPLPDAAADRIPLPPPPLPPPPPMVRPGLLHAPGAWALWYIRHDRFDAQGHILPRPSTQPLLEVTIELLALATGPVSTFRLFACLFLGTLFVWLWYMRSLRTLLPWIGNLIVGEALWIADHHTGMLFIALITAVWLAVAAPRAPDAGSSGRMPLALDRTFVVLLAVVCALQITWTFVSVRNDLHRSYDPGPETAAFLLQHPHRHMAAFDFEAVSVQPYFQHNPFYNLQRSYWVFAINDNPNGAHFETIEQHPDLVLFSEDLLLPGFMHNEWAPLSPITARTQDFDLARNPIILDLEAHGYRETHRFCGDRFMRLGASYRGCHLIFEPAPEP